MIIKHPTEQDIPALRQLWQTVFGDTDSFLEKSLSIREEERLAGAVYWLDCSWQGQPVAYIYALATHPDYRNRGFGKQLMAEVHNTLRQQGYRGVCLVPGESRLEGYYAGLGYQSFGFARNDEIQAEGSAWVTEIDWEDYLQERNRVLKGAVLHSKQNFGFISGFCNFYAGENFLLCGTLDADTLYIQEFLGACRNLPGILAYLGAEKAVYKQLPAMYLALEDSASLPTYFGISMN